MLNFSTFDGYLRASKIGKLDAIVDVILAGDMPPKNYTWMHGEARLTNRQKTELVT